MKRQQFRLGNVLRYYELQKQRAEMELHQASKLLRDADAEIARLNEEIATVAMFLNGTRAGGICTAAWLACYQKSEQLGAQRTVASEQRMQQAEFVKQWEETRKTWAIKEETLRSLEHKVDVFNNDQAAKEQQELLDDAVLRQWLERAEIQEPRTKK